MRRLMQRFRKSRFTIYRAMNQARADVLKRNRPTFLHLSTFDHAEAEQVILSPAVVRKRLNDVLPMHDALTLIEAAHEAPAVDHDLEQKLIAAFNYLKFRAAGAIERMNEAPGSAELDRAETDLRWATLLKRRLVSLTLPSAIRTIEQHLHHSIHHQTSAEITHYIVLAVDVAGRAAQQLDPPRGQRLERLAAYSMNRVLAQMDLSADVKRAAARHESSGIPMHGVLEDIGPAPREIQPWPAMRDVVDRLHAPDAHLIVMRYGWSGEAPRTIGELATTHEMTEAAMSRRLHDIESQLRTLARRNVER
jgi:hypothetical protein